MPHHLPLFPPSCLYRFRLPLLDLCTSVLRRHPLSFLNLILPDFLFSHHVCEYFRPPLRSTGLLSAWPVHTACMSEDRSDLDC
jgi:hypothetical protein